MGDEVVQGEESEGVPSLHAGERAAIHLAQQHQADWLLLDDQPAREQAHVLGLRVKGTLGILVEAYGKEIMSLEEVEIVFQAILHRDDIWISDALVRRVRSAGLEQRGEREG